MRERFIISPDKNSGYPTFSGAIEFEKMVYCKSSDLFFVDGTNYPCIKSDSFSLILGAFANCTKLTKVLIPESVKFIGKNAFRNTKLTSVTIASDCVYSPTSFPDNCEINFY